MRPIEDMSDTEIVTYLKIVMQDESNAENIRKEIEDNLMTRLADKEAAGEKARIQLIGGEDVSLGDDKLFFTYSEVNLDKVHAWLKTNGLANLIKEPKVHHSSLNSNLRELVNKGVDIPEFMGIESRRTLTKRGMKS